MIKYFDNMSRNYYGATLAIEIATNQRSLYEVSTGMVLGISSPAMQLWWHTDSPKIRSQFQSSPIQSMFIAVQENISQQPMQISM